MELVNDLKAIVSDVIDSKDAIKAAEPRMVRQVERAFGYPAPHMPACIVKAKTDDEIAAVFKYCSQNDVHVIAITGGSSSEDNLLVTDDRTIYLDASNMNAILNIDRENMVVAVQGGLSMELLEEKLESMNLTTGHCPQSRPLAAVGGLVATRSIGQFSTYYGGIEDMVCGLKAVLPTGEKIEIRPVPRRSAGPDLRQLFVGCEGAYAFITEVTLKLHEYHPETMWMGGYIVKDFQTGIDCIRKIMVSGYKPSVVRLYDKADVDENYGSVKLKDNEAFMFFTVEGPADINQVTGAAIDRISKEEYQAEYIGTAAVEHWFATRNNICQKIGKPEDIARFKETGIYNSTIEICANWTEIGDIYKEAMANLPEMIPNITMLGGHVSHSYINGTNVYFVYSLKIDNPQEATAEIRTFIYALCDIVLKYHSGTIVHHHGVGKVRVKRIREELGSSYILLEKIKKSLDPSGIMNPGCLIPLS